MRSLTKASCAAFCAVLLALSVRALALPYPVQPLRLVVTFPAGSAVDVQARVLAREMQERFGQTIIVDNRPGKSGLLGAEIVASAAPDGQTMLFTSAMLAISRSLHASRMKHDPAKSLTPVSRTTSTPLVLVVHPALPARSPRELIDVSRKRPTVLNAAIGFTGSTSHLSAELLKQRAGLEFATIAYKGGGMSLVAVMGGEVDFHFAIGGLAARQLKLGKVRPLAVTSAAPSEHFPGLPTMDSVLPGFVIDEWFALFFPGGTRPEVVATVNGALQNALETKFVRAFLASEALKVVGSSPEELATYLERETRRYADIIRKSNMAFE